MTSSVLVTGAHRSGTTWVGRMLALTPEVVYVHEPFNVDHPHDLCARSFKHWYTYAPEGSAQPFRAALRKVLELRYPIGTHLRETDNWRDRYRAIRCWASYARLRWTGRSVLLKDPLALLSAAWMADRFGLNVLIMIRHPAAFAGSLKVKGWTFPFEDFLAQPQLIEDHFEDYVDDIEAFTENEHDVVDQAALLWTLLYSVVRKYQNRHPEWLYLRHEDVAQNPVATFESLYDTFSLDFTDSIQQEVKAHSRSSTSEDDLHRDSNAVIRNWTERLTACEIERVRRRVEPVASYYYSEDDW